MPKFMKIFKGFYIFFRGLIWLFFGLGRGKLSKIWWTYKYGGLKLCLELAILKFGNVYNIYDHKSNQLTIKQCEFIIKRFKEKPLISIVTPVYKIHPKWLNKCIQSVIGQYYKNWELILVDDASNQRNITKWFSFRTKTVKSMPATSKI